MSYWYFCHQHSSKVKKLKMIEMPIILSYGDYYIVLCSSSYVRFYATTILFEVKWKCSRQASSWLNLVCPSNLHPHAALFLCRIFYTNNIVPIATFFREVPLITYWSIPKSFYPHHYIPEIISPSFYPQSFYPQILYPQFILSPNFLSPKIRKFQMGDRMRQG